MKKKISSTMISAASIAVIVLTIAAITTSVIGTTSAQPADPVTELNAIAINTDRNVWTSTYDTLRTTSSYSWMDWSVDGCSVPPAADAATLGRSGQFETACERHDLAWRTLAVIDDGDVWNQRNRLVADKKFHSDMIDVCQDAYPYIMGSEANDAQRGVCLAAALVYYRGVRTAHWPPGTSTIGIMSGGTNPETQAEMDSAVANPNYITDSAFDDRPLPINYLSYRGNPLAPQNITRLPAGTALAVTLTAANQLATNGTLPTGNNWSHYYKTNHLRVRANYPAHVSTLPNSPCPTGSTNSIIDFTSSTPATPFPTNGNQRTEHNLYLKLCAEYTNGSEELVEINPIEARLQTSYSYQVGSRLRHYQNITARNLTPSLSPNPETLTLSNDGTWSSRITVTGNNNLTNVRVIANPNDTTPSVEFHTSNSSNHCSNGAETNDRRDITSGQYIYVAMCLSGTGTLELRDPETDITLATYTISGSATTVSPTNTPTPTPTSTPTPQPEHQLSPTNVSATPSTSYTGRVYVYWTPAADAVHHMVVWSQQADTSGNNSGFLSATSSSWTVTGLDSNQPYWFYVLGIRYDENQQVEYDYVVVSATPN